jgi:hypothetical protein
MNANLPYSLLPFHRSDSSLQRYPRSLYIRLGVCNVGLPQSAPAVEVSIHIIKKRDIIGEGGKHTPSKQMVYSSHMVESSVCEDSYPFCSHSQRKAAYSVFKDLRLATGALVRVGGSGSNPRMASSNQESILVSFHLLFYATVHKVYNDPETFNRVPTKLISISLTVVGVYYLHILWTFGGGEAKRRRMGRIVGDDTPSKWMTFARKSHRE